MFKITSILTENRGYLAFNRNAKKNTTIYSKYYLFNIIFRINVIKYYK